MHILILPRLHVSVPSFFSVDVCGIDREIYAWPGIRQHRAPAEWCYRRGEDNFLEKFPGRKLEEGRKHLSAHHKHNMPRKKPFSGKKKKEQLKAKRERKRGEVEGAFVLVSFCSKTKIERPLR